MLTIYSQFAALALCGALIVKLIQLLVSEHHLTKSLPPSPPGLPLLGNALQIPKFQWLRFSEWSAQYGPIFSLNLAGQRIIVLNDFKTASALLDRRSSIYAHRPIYRMVGIISKGLSLTFMEHGDLWRRSRRAVHESFSNQACEAYHPLIENRAAVLLSHLAHSSGCWDVPFQRFVGSVVLGVNYGGNPTDRSTDSIMGRMNAFMEVVTNSMLPGAYLVEFFPSMMRIPSWAAKWKRDGERWYQEGDKIFMELFEQADAIMAHDDTSGLKGELPFAAKLLAADSKAGLSRQEAAWLAGAMLGGGVSTTAAVLSVLMLALVLHPESQRRAQEQLDFVVGRERLPALSDREQLPYIDAVVKECLRWRPVGPLAVPRRCTQDDWYGEHLIPKGSVVLCNVWAMNHDAQCFPDHDEFRPERYLDAEGQLSDDIPDTHHIGHMSFGTGRRVCPGREMAERTLFMAAASILWAFNVDCATDEASRPLVPSRTECIDEGAVVHPPSFRCKFTPRFADVMGFIPTMTREDKHES